MLVTLPGLKGYEIYFEVDLYCKVFACACEWNLFLADRNDTEIEKGCEIHIYRAITKTLVQSKGHSCITLAQMVCTAIIIEKLTELLGSRRAETKDSR